MTTVAAGLLGVAVFWGLAAFVAFDDIDFFSWGDFRDTAGLHHEHIFVGLVVLGLVAAIFPAPVLGPRGHEMRRRGAPQDERAGSGRASRER